LAAAATAAVLLAVCCLNTALIVDRAWTSMLPTMEHTTHFTRSDALESFSFVPGVDLPAGLLVMWRVLLSANRRWQQSPPPLVITAALLWLGPYLLLLLLLLLLLCLINVV
jgi:hypothetical protein